MVPRPPEFPEQVDSLPERIAGALAKVSLAVRHQARERAVGEGLSPTQGQILAVLLAGPGSGVGEVARALAIRPPAASEAISSLVAKGLVVRKATQEDRRRLQLSLTPAGVAAAERTRRWPDFLAESVTDLSASEQATFLRVLLLTIGRLQERGEIPIGRMCVTCTHFRPNVYRDLERPHHCALVDAPFGDRHLRVDCPDHRALVAAGDGRSVSSSAGARR